MVPSERSISERCSKLLDRCILICSPNEVVDIAKAVTAGEREAVSGGVEGRFRVLALDSRLSPHGCAC